MERQGAGIAGGFDVRKWNVVDPFVYGASCADKFPCGVTFPISGLALEVVVFVRRHGPEDCQCA